MWMTLQGRKDERLRIAAIYRPNPGYPTDGLTTVWSQQRVRLQELAFLNNDVVEIDPREQCLTDFKKWIHEQRENGEKVVVLTDANQNVTERTTAYSLLNLVTDCQLRSTTENPYPEQPLRSLDQGNKTVDHILTSGIEQVQVCKVGQLPFGLGFSSDHWDMFANLKTDEILHLHMEEPVQGEGRWLSSKNKKYRRISVI